MLIVNKETYSLKDPNERARLKEDILKCGGRIEGITDPQSGYVVTRWYKKSSTSVPYVKSAYEAINDAYQKDISRQERALNRCSKKVTESACRDLRSISTLEYYPWASQINGESQFQNVISSQCSTQLSASDFDSVASLKSRIDFLKTNGKSKECQNTIKHLKTLERGVKKREAALKREAEERAECKRLGARKLNSYCNGNTSCIEREVEYYLTKCRKYTNW